MYSTAAIIRSADKRRKLPSTCFPDLIRPSMIAFTTLGRFSKLPFCVAVARESKSPATGGSLQTGSGVSSIVFSRDVRMSLDLRASVVSLSLRPMPLNFSSKSLVVGSVSFGAMSRRLEQEIDVLSELFTSNFDRDQHEFMTHFAQKSNPFQI